MPTNKMLKKSSTNLNDIVEHHNASQLSKINEKRETGYDDTNEKVPIKNYTNIIDSGDHDASHTININKRFETDYFNTNNNSKKSSPKKKDKNEHHTVSQNIYFDGENETGYDNAKKSSGSGSNNYTCEVCNYTTVRYSQRKRHESTHKHKLLLLKKNINNEQEKSNICDCGRKYVFLSSLCFHRKTCIYLKNQSSNNKPDIIKSKDISDDEFLIDETVTTSHHGIDDYTTNNIIIKLLKDNEEMKKIIMEQNQQQTQIMLQQQQQQQQQQQIIEMLPKLCVGNNITNNNNIKQKFNLNFFLNEQCKDAINMCDFVKSLNITFDDLNVTRDKSLEDSVGSIFLRGLKELDVFKRPIHCTDIKRDVMYIKEEDNWTKDEGNEKLKNSIGQVSRKQVKTLKELKDSDPEIKTNDTKRDEFILTMNHVCTPIPDSGEKRIIKTISKEVIVSS